MRSSAVIDRLYLENKASFQEDVDLECGIENLSIKGNRNNDLSLNPQTTPFKSTG